MDQAELIELMKKKQGKRSAADFAAELGISPQYLSHIYLGKTEPGPTVLKALGLKREYIYTKE